MKKSPEMRTWEVSRIKGTPPAILCRIKQRAALRADGDVRILKEKVPGASAPASSCYPFRAVHRRARLSPRDAARCLHTRRSAMTFTVAASTSAQRAAFDIVSIVPSIRMPWTTLPATMTTASDI